MSLLSGEVNKEIRNFQLVTRRNFLLSFREDLRELYERDYLDEEQIKILEKQLLEVYSPKSESFKET